MLRTNGRLIVLGANETLNNIIHDALEELGLDANEEPTGSVDNDKSYITWRVSRVRTLGASGRTVARHYHMTVTLWAVKNDDHAAVTVRITELLRAAGATFAVKGGDAWMEDVSRRACEVSCLFRVSEASDA